MGNVVIVTHWLEGDVIPFVRIGVELKRRGHTVKLITHCHFQEMAEKAGLGFESWDTPEEYASLVEQMQQNKYDNSYSSNRFSYISNEFRQNTESIESRLKEYRIVDKCCQNPDTVILCKCRSSIAAYLVAEKRKLPLATVVVNPSEIASMLLFESLQGRHDVPRLNKLREMVGLDPIDSWLQWESSAKMSLALWPSWYERIDNQWPTKIETVGFPYELGKDMYRQEIPQAFSEWLEHHPKPILITGGTTKLLNNDFYARSIEACGSLGHPTILLCRYAEFLPKVLPDNVVWYKYLPLDEVMPKLSVIIHHGGIGTVTGGLASGVPQLILPDFVDRPYNATLIKEMGAGDYLLPREWTPEKIVEKIKSLQENDFGVSCPQYVEKMKANRGISCAADYVELLMKCREKYTYTVQSGYQHCEDTLEIVDTDLSRKQSVTIQNLSNDQRVRLRLSLKNRIRADKREK